MTRLALETLREQCWHQLLKLDNENLDIVISIWISSTNFFNLKLVFQNNFAFWASFINFKKVLKFRRHVALILYYVNFLKVLFMIEIFHHLQFLPPFLKFFLVSKLKFKFDVQLCHLQSTLNWFMRNKSLFNFVSIIHNLALKDVTFRVMFLWNMFTSVHFFPCGNTVLISHCVNFKTSLVL